MIMYRGGTGWTRCLKYTGYFFALPVLGFAALMLVVG
jgi:hypothetical protein